MINKVQKGFTLIELMIVVAIIGILAAIAIPQYQDYVAKSQITSALAEIEPLKTTAEELLLRGRYTEAKTASTPNAFSFLGFTGSTFGTLSETNDISDGVGELVITLDGNVATAIQNTTITLDRDADGSWECIVSEGASGWDFTYMPTGCDSLDDQNAEYTALGT